MKVVIAIPALKPPQSLLSFVGALADRGYRVFVLDDGSGPEYGSLFHSLTELPLVSVAAHPATQGKGAALKSLYRVILAEAPDATSVVAADADGQHKLEDVLRLAEATGQTPEQVILGVRLFDGGVPWRSLLGNLATRLLIKWLTGLDVVDSQTGLRVLPIRLLPLVMGLTTTQYDFELDALLLLHERGETFRQLPVATVYEPGNPSSHFHVWRDSLRIYGVLARRAAMRRRSGPS